jgi:hypothetical protein
MNKSLTEVAAILDMSGSMEVVTEDSIGGFNTFVEKQREEPGECRMTVVLFNSNEHRKWVDGKSVRDVPKLTKDTYRATGNTPLLDSVGRTINELGAKLDKMTETDRPGKVIVIVITDGMENASTEFTRARIREMIRHQEEKYSWTFLYLGANQDAFAEASSIGIQYCNSANYVNTPRGLRHAYRAMNFAVSSGRAGGQCVGLGRDIGEEEPVITTSVTPPAPPAPAPSAVPDPKSKKSKRR